jgi:hypothetical protein
VLRAEGVKECCLVSARTKHGVDELFGRIYAEARKVVVKRAGDPVRAASNTAAADDTEDESLWSALCEMISTAQPDDGKSMCTIC